MKDPVNHEIQSVADTRRQHVQYAPLGDWTTRLDINQLKSSQRRDPSQELQELELVEREASIRKCFRGNDVRVWRFKMV